jgi:hypothetical protein
VAGAAATAWGVGRVAKMVKAVTQSPRYKFVTGQMKDDLANAIMSGRVQDITAALGRMAAVTGSKVGTGNGEQ